MLAGGKVKLVAVAHVSNVLGTINPVAEIARRARAAGAVSLIDGAQSVPQMPVDLGAIDADFYAWTGHKALGPATGLLHGRRELLLEMPPFLSGGHMISRVERDHSTWNELPWKFEAGTNAIAEAIGLGAAIDYLGEIGMERVREHERDLTAYALERLPEVEGITLYGPDSVDKRGGVVPFTIEGMHPHDIAELCDREAVCVRAGHHCAQPLMRCLGVGATARASFHVYNSREDVDRLVHALGSRAGGVRPLVDALYRDYILDHYKNPRNFGELEPHDLEFHDHNPLCGDELGVHIVVEDGKVAAAALPRPRLRDLAGGRLDQLGRADRDAGRRREQAGRRLGDRPARHRHLPHAPQVRAAQPEGDARRDDGRSELAGVALAHSTISFEPWITSPSSVSSTGTQFLPVRSRTGLRVGLSAVPRAPQPYVRWTSGSQPASFSAS